MNVYVETNFLLELAFEQEQHESCAQILEFCEQGRSTLILPAYCFVEPHEKLIRQARRRRELQESLDAEVRQLIRSSSNAVRLDNIKNIEDLLTEINDEERLRFGRIRGRLMIMAEIVPLTIEILREAPGFEARLNLAPQDAIVYASVRSHLQIANGAPGCFLNRNPKDFNVPAIIAELKAMNCKMIPSFDDAWNFLQSRFV